MNKYLISWAIAFVVVFGVFKAASAYKNPWALAATPRGCGVECGE